MRRLQHNLIASIESATSAVSQHWLAAAKKVTKLDGPQDVILRWHKFAPRHVRQLRSELLEIEGYIGADAHDLKTWGKAIIACAFDENAAKERSRVPASLHMIGDVALVGWSGRQLQGKTFLQPVPDRQGTFATVVRVGEESYFGSLGTVDPNVGARSFEVLRTERVGDFITEVPGGLYGI